MEISEQTLKNFSAGNEEAYNTIFESYYRGLCMFSLKITHDRASSEEIVQDLFVKLWDERLKLNIKISLQAYLYKSVFNNSIAFVKKNKKFVSEENLKYIEQPEDTDESDAVDLAILEEKIYKTIEQLPPKCRDVFKLNRFDGLKYKQIAEKLNLSVKTVEAHISKALRILHENIKN